MDRIDQVRVRYERVEGWHVFTSPDLDGLYIASSDPKKAFDAIAPAIRELYFFNKKVRVKRIKAPFSLKDFLSSIKEHMDDPNVAPLYLMESGAVFQVAA